MNEIPNQIYVSLGRRGFDPIKLKYCHVCNNPTITDLELLEKKVEEERVEGKNSVLIINYKIKDKKCGGIFYIQLNHVYTEEEGEKKRITTKVHILNDKKEDMGWLGNY